MISVNMILGDLYTNVIYSFDETFGLDGPGTCCYADFTLFVVVISYDAYTLFTCRICLIMQNRWIRPLQQDLT